VPKEKGVDNPSYTEIRDVCSAAGMVLGVEVRKLLFMKPDT
jgi:signal recognition particle subunit SEC65